MSEMFAPRLLIDAHEDIAWNVRSFGRDYRRSALETRRREADTPFPSYNGNTLLGKAEWLLGHVGIIFATTFVAPARRRMGAWDTQSYATAQQAYDLVNAQLDVYHRLADEDAQIALVGTQADLDAVLKSWDGDQPLADRRIGLVPLMEGADAIREPAEVEYWYERGVRIVGLAWEATRYAGGTHEPGPLTTLGHELIEAMASINMVLDLSHLAEEAYFQAATRYEGPLIASHANPYRFCPTTRGLTDHMIDVLAERGGVVGIVGYNAFLKPGWRKGDRRSEVGLLTIVDAIDHVCQVTGSAEHVGIGTDFDGGLGVEHVPSGVDTIADLQKIVVLLAERGYTDEQIDAIFHGNWLRVLRTALPE